MMTSTKNTRRHILTASAAVLCAFIVPTSVHAQAYQYSVTVLSAVGSSSAYPVSINASGLVAGPIVHSISGQETATVWNGTTPTSLAPLNAGYSAIAYGINNSGQVVGNADNASGRKAVVWNGTTPTILAGNGSAYAINASGKIAGSYSHGLVWDAATPTAIPTTLGSLGGSESRAYGINDAGQVTGWSKTPGDAITNAVRWNGTTPTALGGLGGYSYGYAINNPISGPGQVAGVAYTPSNQQAKAVIWNGTTPTLLGSLGDSPAAAYGINDAGEAIGSSGGRAFFTTGGAMYDLNTLLVPGSGVTQLFISQFGNGINNSGQIAATGSYGGQQVIVRLSRSYIPDPAVLYWSGTQDNTWNKASNWAINLAGATAVSAGPVGTTDVIFSTTAITALPITTTLGADMAVRSLTMNDTNAVSIGGANTLTITGDNAVTVSSGAGMLTVSSGLALTPAGVSAPVVMVNNNAGVLISGATSGTKGLEKTGSGILTLSGTNTYGGATTVTAGTLVATSATALGATAAGTTITSGATLDVQADLGTEGITVGGTGSDGSGALLASTGTGTVGGAVVLTAATTLGGEGALSINGAVTGGYGITKVGGGVTSFGAAPGSLAGVGNLTAEGGTTNVNSGLGGGTSNVSVTGTTTLRFGSVSQTLSSLTIGAGSTVIFTSGLASGAFGGGGGKVAGLGGNATVPEPGTLGLLVIGALGVLNRRRRV